MAMISWSADPVYLSNNKIYILKTLPNSHFRFFLQRESKERLVIIYKYLLN